jgi:hypothetical protein
MHHGIDEENNLPKAHPAYTRWLSPFSYSLAFVLGGLGTYFAFKSDVDDEDNISSRTSYSLILGLSGLLITVARAGRIFATSAIDRQSAQPIQSSSNIILSSDESKLSIEEDKSEKAISPWRLSNLARIFHFVEEASPLIWFGAAGNLMIRNAIQEFAGGEFFPYTTIAGLVTGQLFYITTKPWKLGGISHWLQNNHKDLTYFEFSLVLLLPSIYKINNLFYCATASFWTGYNLDMLFFNQISSRFAKLMEAKSNKNVTAPSLDEKSRPACRSQHGLVFTLGMALLGLSYALLESLPNDSSGWRNVWAELLSALGGYALTYHVGRYIGRKIPERYHDLTQTVCIYLLIPCASPALSILHQILILGGGLCGGAADYIASSRYRSRMKAIELSLGEIKAKAVTRESRELLSQLLEGRADNDEILENERKKYKPLYRMGIAFNSSVIVLGLSLFIVSLTEGSSSDWSRVWVSMMATRAFALLTVYRILPKRAPSIYQAEKLPRYLRFLYTDSLTLTFIYKILASMVFKNIHGKSLSNMKDIAELTPATIFIINLFFIPSTIFVIKAGFKKLFGSYVPYVPSPAEISSLSLLLDSASLSDNKITKEEKYETPPLSPALRSTPVRINYHLLKFIQENSKKLDIPEQKRVGTPLILETFFNDEDKAYTSKRFNIDFELKAVDAVLRGAGVVQQFPFSLPETLSLVNGVKFSF